MYQKSVKDIGSIPPNVSTATILEVNYLPQLVLERVLLWIINLQSEHEELNLVC